LFQLLIAERIIVVFWHPFTIHRSLISFETLHKRLVKLSCSTSNASRSGGGTSYYCIPRSHINYLCSSIDAQIPSTLMHIQVDPDLLPTIRSAYTHDIAEKMGHLRPDIREQLVKALKSVDEEEVRMLRLYAIGKITETIWDALRQEWQDRRSILRLSLQGLEKQQEVHIENLDAALKIIAKVGMVYNSLERGDQKELLRQMVERVIIDPAGKIRLELRTPFAYLQDLCDEVRGRVGRSEPSRKAKTGSMTTGLSSGKCSTLILSRWEDRIRFEPLTRETAAEFLHHITFPQRAQLARLTTTET
jgi:hypothetical protein